MSEIVLKEGQLMDFSPIEKSEKRIYSANITIYYVLSGRMTVSSVTSGHRIVLSNKDFLVVNAYLSHSVMLDQRCLAIKYAVSPDVLSAFYDISKIEFFGNSVEETSEDHDAMKRLLDECIRHYYGKRAMDGRTLLKLNSLYYRIAELLIFSFSIVKGDQSSLMDSEESMIQEMEKYVRLNYKLPIKLESMAEHFYLSVSYVSRFFKKKTGSNFLKYLTDIRLDASERELVNSDKAISRIAADSGFPNISAFNKAFRERYGMNPKDYKKMIQERGERNDYLLDEQDVSFQLMDYIEHSREMLEPEESKHQIEQVEADTEQYSVLYKSWNKMINIGGVSMLLQKAVQDHVLFLHKQLKYEYFRVWDLFAREMYLHVGDEEKKINFTRLDICMDFLTENHLKPYIELGFKPHILIKDYAHYTINETREIIFKTARAYGEFVKKMISHFINRYSAQEVASWIFELWCDPRWFTDGDPTEYLAYFEQIYQNIKTVSPMTRVGGDYDRTFGIVDFDRLVSKWSARNIQPDFFSIYCYQPVIKEREVGDVADVNSARAFSVRDYIEEKRKILMLYGMRMSLYVSEWNFTVVNVNPLNDSTFKGAYIMDTLMECYDSADYLGYWFGTDLFAENEDTPLLLNGRCGLITHQKICKPAFWAVWFMNRHEDYLLARTKHAMITKNDFDSYVITCHNFKKPDVQYYVQKEHEVTVEQVHQMYEDNQRLVVKIRINGVENGTYHVKVRSVSSVNGSVQDEWLRMGKVAYLTTRDVEYSEHMSRPRMTIEQQVVTNHTLFITADMEAQEIQLIHAFRYVAEE